MYKGGIVAACEQQRAEGEEYQTEFRVRRSVCQRFGFPHVHPALSVDRADAGASYRVGGLQAVGGLLSEAGATGSFPFPLV